MNWMEAERSLAAALAPLYGEGEAHAMADWVMDVLSGMKKTERTFTRMGPDGAQKVKLEEIRKRLLQQEPLQYVLQESWFCGLRFYVDRRVLIPRPETEELVEWVISNCRFPVDEWTIIDIGTGSGCIPVSLKRRIRKADVWTADISADALEVARMNAERLGTPIHFLLLDFLDEKNWPAFPSADVIVSNPPYIPLQEASALEANVREHEPARALFVPNEDALLFYRYLAAFGKMKLKPGGAIYAEIHAPMADAVLQLFREAGYRTELKKDMQGTERMIRAGI